MNGPNVVVVGAGILGTSIAWRLAQSGAQVTVLERAIPGAEASSAAAGILAPQAEADGPGPLLELSLRSRALYADFAAELSNAAELEVGYRRCGLLKVAQSEAGAARLEATVAWQSAMGLRAELLSTEQARRLEPHLSTSVLAAAHFPDDHQVDNRLLMRALTIAAAKAGVRFRQGYVRKVLSDEGRALGVDVDGEALRADATVVAAGSWSSLLDGVLREPSQVRPVRGQMVQLQTRVPLLSRVVFSERGYLVPRADGRVIAGSTVEHVGFDKQVTAEGLHAILEMALQVCPELKSAPVHELWAGLRPYTDDHLPILGEGPLRDLFVATGHFRNGILLTPITAKTMALLVLGKRPSVDLRPFRFDREGQER